MNKKLLDYLVCPYTQQTLELDILEEINNEIKEGTLMTKDGKYIYKITNYIPRFVQTDDYVDSFSLEWETHKTTQLDSANENKEANEKFFRHTSFPEDQLKNKLVLDVGCGIGRFMEVVNNHGGEIIGIDMSYSIDTAYQNIGTKTNVHLIQADIFHLPFKKDIFDFIYSIGVLHHTPSTKKAFLQLPQFLKKGGEIAISVYSNEGIKTKLGNKFSEVIRYFTKRTNKIKLHKFCSKITPLLLKIKKIPFLSVLISFLPIKKDYSIKYATLEIFDHLSPWYQDYHTYKEVQGWFKKANLKNIKKLPIPVSVIGKKE